MLGLHDYDKQILKARWISSDQGRWPVGVNLCASEIQSHWSWVGIYANAAWRRLQTVHLCKHSQRLVCLQSLSVRHKKCQRHFAAFYAKPTEGHPVCGRFPRWRFRFNQWYERRRSLGKPWRCSQAHSASKLTAVATSRTLNPAKRNYSMVKKKALVCVFGVSKNAPIRVYEKIRIDDRPSSPPESSPLESVEWGQGNYPVVRPHSALNYESVQLWLYHSVQARLWKTLCRRFEQIATVSCTNHGTSAGGCCLVNGCVWLWRIPDYSQADRVFNSYKPSLSAVVRCVQTGNWSLPHELHDEAKPFQLRKLQSSWHAGCLLWGNRVVIPRQGRRVTIPG